MFVLNICSCVKTNPSLFRFLSLFVGISRLYHKRKETVTAIEACNYALDIDNQCDKALFLRATIRASPKSAGATEVELSFKDAVSAQKLLHGKLLELDKVIKSTAKQVKPNKTASVASPLTIEGDSSEDHQLLELGDDGAFDLDHASSTVSLAGDEEYQDEVGVVYDETDENVMAKKEVMKRYREVSKYVNNLRVDKMKQRDLDKTWNGVFEKGVIYDPSSISQTKVGATNEGDEGMPASVANQITDAQRLLQMYEQSNRHDDAERIRNDVHAAKTKYER